eukprot:258630_1
MDDSKETSPVQCNEMFELCAHSNRIKLILKAYNKIISDKNNKIDNYNTLQQEVETVINNMSSDTSYSNVELLNDLYHIKYNHSVNDDPNQFNLFFQYLFDHDGVSKCDISCCQSVKRHYNRRNPSFYEDNKSENVTNTRSLDLICRIHTYFMHSPQLTCAEIEYIENKLNELELKEDETDMLHHKKMELLLETINNKNTDSLPSNKQYILSENKIINYDKISHLLEDHKMNIDVVDLQDGFDKYGYHSQQLMDDLCTILFNKTDKNILLTQILHEMNVKVISNVLTLFVYAVWEGGIKVVWEIFRFEISIHLVLGNIVIFPSKVDPIHRQHKGNLSSETNLKKT